MKSTEMVCIVCPNGCRLTVTQDGDSINVQGATCKKGVDFAKTELTAPTRSLTSTVQTSFSAMPRLPVKTDGEIPKEKLLEAIKIIRTVKVTEPLHTGDIVIEDLFGTKLIATSDINL
jgi:CxxC motif-containing protein